MASLHKDPRGKSPYFYAAFTLRDGRRAFRPTKETNRAKAAEIARQWEKAAKLGRAGNLTEMQARRVLDDILESAGQGRMSSQRVEEFFAGWLESKGASKFGGTSRRYRYIVTSFLEHLGASRRRVPLTSLTPRDVATFRDGLLTAGLANKSANLAWKVVRAALNAARRQGLILTNPAEAVETLPDDSSERGTFTPEDLRALLAVADAEWRGVILLGYTAGLRIGDAAWAAMGGRGLLRARPAAPVPPAEDRPHGDQAQTAGAAHRARFGNSRTGLVKLVEATFRDVLNANHARGHLRP